MEEIIVTNVVQYLENLNDQHAWLFRGVNKKNFELIPGIARGWKEQLDITSLETTFLRKFKDQSIAYLNPLPSSDWEWLMLAQHHGMQTRLLDWTENPLVALYFTCEKEFEDDGRVYRISDVPTLNSSIYSNPFAVPQDFVIRPPHILPRIAAQSALFTVSSNPVKPLEFGDSYHKIIIQASQKKYILSELDRYGINSATLFPGLDGISKKLSLELSRYKDVIIRTTEDITNS